MAQQKTRSKGRAKTKKQARGSGELERYHKALEELERALKSLYKGDADKALTLLQRLEENHPGELELMDRVRSYVRVCEQQLSSAKRPKTAEEMVTLGIIHLNDGDTSGAIKHLLKAAEMEPKNGHVHYCLAAAYARSGDAMSSAKYLKQAIQEDPTSLVSARSDTDFDRVRDEREVAAIIASA